MVCLAVPLLDAESPIVDSAWCVEFVDSCCGCPSEALGVSGHGADGLPIRCAMWVVVLVIELVFRRRSVWVVGSCEGRVWLSCGGGWLGFLSVVAVVSLCVERALGASPRPLAG